jgi:hypothetical protein
MIQINAGSFSYMAAGQYAVHWEMLMEVGKAPAAKDDGPDQASWFLALLRRDLRLSHAACGGGRASRRARKRCRR